jgi:murein DD-endopeptidase MepM/ murein hydrolase activator NlpD
MKFFWPLENIFITQKFGNPSKGYTIGYHMGIDLRAKTGTPVFAAQSGKVYKAKDLAPFDGYGAYIAIKHDNDYYTIYAHLDKVLVKQGQDIKQGQLIGYSGGNPRNYGAKAGQNKVNNQYTKAGFSTADHLHFEIDKGGLAPKYGIDPEPITSQINLSNMQQQNDSNFIPEWAAKAVEKIRAKGIKLENPAETLNKYEFAVILDKLGLFN